MEQKMDWYDRQSELEIMSIIKDLESNENAELFKFLSMEYDVQLQTMVIYVKIRRSDMKYIVKNRNDIKGESVLLNLRKLVLDIVASKLIAKPYRCKLIAKAFLCKDLEVYNGEIHNSDHSYAKLR